MLNRVIKQRKFDNAFYVHALQFLNVNKLRDTVNGNFSTIYPETSNLPK
jgi:hypothetical protein